ncbi:MAG: Ppx/GppA phosphatase family protein [Balneolaceae bacterium]
MIISGNSKQIVPVKRLAAIDLGTNSFHAVIADVYSDGSFRTLDTFKEMVQLAKGGLENRLSDGAFKRGMKALRNIKRLCDSYECDKVLAYATSAIRESANGGEFIQRSIDELDIKINAIPGKVEAELIGYAVQHGVKLGKKPALMVDIGGGSVEFIIGNDKEFFFLASKKLGVSRMTGVFKPSDPITPKDIEKLETHYAGQLKDVIGAVSTHQIETIIGSSGTMQNIGLMIAARQHKSADVKLNELVYSADDFASFYSDFIKLNSKERQKVAGLDSKRVSFINTGVVLLRYLIRECGIKKVRISSQALKEGIIIRYLKKDMIGLPWNGDFADPRRRSIFELLRKCAWHESHSRHVANMALTIFDVLKDELELSKNDRELLEFASYLHDIGYYISHSAHHKHALYIIRNSELRGFKEEEIEIMANVARYHRRSTPKKRHGEYWKMSPEIRRRIKKLSGILRVADGLDRSHYQNVKQLDVFLGEQELKLNIRTEGEPYLEIWGAMRKSTLLQEVTGRKVKIERVLGNS